MRSQIQTFPHPMKIAITVCLAAALCGWFAAYPWAALRFWSGVLIGALGVTLGWLWWKRTVPHRADRCFKIFALILLVWSALALWPQRDVPVIAAPFGLWLVLTVAMAITQPWLKRA
jgi:hypothetical protein